MNIIDQLEKDMAVIAAKIKEIQNECSHPKLSLAKQHGSNTGNYDPGADCYWTDFTCGLCRKRWTENGSK